MKLRTEMKPFHDGKTIPVALDPSESFFMIEHDAAAAHALMQAIQNRIHAAEDRCDNTKILAMNGVLNYADEIMAGWGFREARES